MSTLYSNARYLILDDYYEKHYDAEVGINIKPTKLDDLVLRRTDSDSPDVLIYKLVNPNKLSEELGVIYIYRGVT